MKQFTTSKDAFRSLSIEIGDNDCPDRAIHAPRRSRARRAKSHHGESASGPGDRKAWQLCRQVSHTLDEVLAGCRDAVLQGLRVDGVEPFPDASRLLVTVAFIDDRPAQLAEVERVLHHLERASGHLRSEVATAVTRKRAPVLIYKLADPPMG